MALNGKIRILDTVFREITQKDSKGNRDELAIWALNLFEDRQFSHKTDEVGAAYARIQDYLVTCGLYREDSYRQWLLQWGCGQGADDEFARILRCQR